MLNEVYPERNAPKGMIVRDTRLILAADLIGQLTMIWTICSQNASNSPKHGIVDFSAVAMVQSRLNCDNPTQNYRKTPNIDECALIVDDASSRGWPLWRFSAAAARIQIDRSGERSRYP